MKIGSEYRVFPDRNTWPEAARQLGVDPTALLDRARELANAAPEAFADAVRAPAVATLHRPLPDKLLALVADRAARCVKLLHQGPDRSEVT